MCANEGGKRPTATEFEDQMGRTSKVMQNLSHET